MAIDNTRTTAARIVQRLLLQQGSLSTLLEEFITEKNKDDKPLIQALCFGICRHYEQLNYIANTALAKPLRKKDLDIFCLILVGVYQLFFMHMPDYAIINSAVESCVKLKKPWAKSLVNAVLRSVQREQTALETLLQTDRHLKYSHPEWLETMLKQNWPDDFHAIMHANNQHPPMSLRVNLSRINRADFQKQLETAQLNFRCGELTGSSLLLDTPIPVENLPGFAEGLVSVQDEASQLAAELLNPQQYDSVLDACAAPGGKSCAILERATAIDLFAVDNDAARLKRIEENLQRSGLAANVIHNDIINQARAWQQHRFFDRILLDVPCSAIGVIRRHPDIKILRQPEDIEKLIPIQQAILDAVWPLLKPGGLLLYATCSVLKAENEDQIKTFLSHHNDARESPLKVTWGKKCEFGRQLLPSADSHDGFYYALIQKC